MNGEPEEKRFFHEVRRQWGFYTKECEYLQSMNADNSSIFLCFPDEGNEILEVTKSLLIDIDKYIDKS